MTRKSIQIQARDRDESPQSPRPNQITWWKRHPVLGFPNVASQLSRPYRACNQGPFSMWDSWLNSCIELVSSAFSLPYASSTLYWHGRRSQPPQRGQRVARWPHCQGAQVPGERWVAGAQGSLSSLGGGWGHCWRVTNHCPLLCVFCSQSCSLAHSITQPVTHSLNVVWSHQWFIQQASVIVIAVDLPEQACWSATPHHTTPTLHYPAWCCADVPSQCERTQ